MRLRGNDLAGTVLVAAVAVLYVSYLTNGRALFITDARGMAATGIVLGWAACMVGGSRFVGAGSRLANALLSFGGTATLGLGLAAVVGMNSAILAAFIAAVVAMWAITVVRHALGSMTAASANSRHAQAGV